MPDGKICGATYNQQIHHIRPRGYVAMHESTKDPNVPENLICLCARHHIGKGLPPALRNQCVHPDTEVARHLYMAGDRLAYKKMSEYRKELNLKGVPYWNTSYDQYLLRRALERNEAMTRPFPYKSQKGDRLNDEG